ncbi:hypothetical protein EI218_11395 [Streptococcus suis]|nr:hypothetical protein EI218_11395 [Streptococcus suis]
MQKHYTPKGKHLTIDNRRLIERWKNENKLSFSFRQRTNIRTWTHSSAPLCYRKYFTYEYRI